MADEHESQPDGETADTLSGAFSSAERSAPAAPDDVEASAAEDRRERVKLPALVPVKARHPGGGQEVDEWPAPRARGATAPRRSRWPRWLAGRAAAVALAAALGAVAGTGLVAGIGLLPPTGGAGARVEIEALRESVGHLARQIESLKEAVARGGQAAAGTVATLEERLDGAERMQSELAARLDELSDGPSRRAAPKPEPVSPETTGSVTAGKPPIAHDWVLWRVRNGRALVQGRPGYFEVAPGSSLPGLGLVQRIMRENGRWVVLTRNGLIVSRG